MRALVSGAVLAIVAAGAAQAVEPSMSFYYSLMQGVSPQDCLQRSRNAMTANSFQLAESTQNSQFATQDDYLALVSCVPSQPTVFFLSIAGPEFARADAAAQRIRAAVTGQAAPPPPAGSK